MYETLTYTGGVHKSEEVKELIEDLGGFILQENILQMELVLNLAIPLEDVDIITNKAKEALKKPTAELTVVLKGDLLTAGTHVLTESNVSIKEGEAEKVDAELVAKLNTKLGLDESKDLRIKTYQNGESYYIARIKHFGDDLTPWAAGDETYGGKNLNWLGRYGVLRNNWYDLTIEKISGPGYPDVPEVKPETPDDEDTKYINVSVKILDWAKRSQSWDL